MFSKYETKLSKILISRCYLYLIDLTMTNFSSSAANVSLVATLQSNTFRPWVLDSPENNLETPISDTFCGSSSEFNHFYRKLSPESVVPRRSGYCQRWPARCATWRWRRRCWRRLPNRSSRTPSEMNRLLALGVVFSVLLIFTWKTSFAHDLKACSCPLSSSPHATSTSRSPPSSPSKLSKYLPKAQ